MHNGQWPVIGGEFILLISTSRGELAMTDRNQSKTYGSWVAIDIAKDFNVVMTETTGGNIRRFRMANSSEDHERLVDTVRSLPQPCRIGFEATGNYHRTLGYRLVAEGLDVDDRDSSFAFLEHRNDLAFGKSAFLQGSLRLKGGSEILLTDVYSEGELTESWRGRWDQLDSLAPSNPFAVLIMAQLQASGHPATGTGA
jgi:hypothetical protein